MKVLVTGSAGLLGSDIVRALEARGIECRGAVRQDFDITDTPAVKAWVGRYRPDAIVHCAGFTDVDRAESAPEVCAAVNGMGTLNLVRAALSVDARMLFVSSDYVFSGAGDRPYRVDDPYGPLNVYGMSKVQGEDAVRSLMTRYYILRTGWLFGKNGDNFVRKILALGAEKKEIRVVSDQIGSPTYTRDFARVVCDMLQTEKYGIYHVQNAGYLSRYDFAKMILDRAGLPGRLTPVTAAGYPLPARRPLNCRLDPSGLAGAGFAPMPPVEQALDRFLDEIRAEA